MRNKRGITLAVLVITVVLMLILSTTVTITSIDTYKVAKMKQFVSEMTLIQKEVDRIAEEKDDIYNMGEELTSDMVSHINNVANRRGNQRSRR